MKDTLRAPTQLLKNIRFCLLPEITSNCIRYQTCISALAIADGGGYRHTMHLLPHCSYNLCTINTGHSKDVRNCRLVCKALCRQHAVNAFFCLEFCSVATGIVLVHSRFLWRTDSSHPCLGHPAQQSNAPGFEA